MQKSIPSLRLCELAEHYDLRFEGDGDTLIDGVGTLSDATGSQLSFLANPAYREQLKGTHAAAVIVSEKDAGICPVNALIAEDPYLAYAKIAERFDPRRPPAPGLHASASIDPTASIGRDVFIGANAVVGPHCEIADACVVGPGCVLAADCHIGKGSRLVANVTICEGVRIGRRTIIHPGAVIGSDGFGLAFDQDHWVKIPQLGSVRIGDDCEIGANTTIDRGAIGDTIIENDVRLDNQIQIGHNVQVGAHTAMAGMVGISGSTKIGKYCMFGGSSGTVGHLRIADRTTVQGLSMITKSITQPGTVWSSGMPAQPSREWNRSIAHLRKLEKLALRVLNLEKQSGKKPQHD
ncbi:MAG: UDP-3-O-(3-hydroxymyristoyl)glucosamine N-acyltransferase [Lysobacterales bacterium]